MLRAVSAALLFLFSFGLIEPALLARPDSNVPACCRRDGKHHCAMQTAAEADAQRQHWAGENCPFAGKHASASAGASFVLVPANRGTFQVSGFYSIWLSVETGKRQFHRGHRDRGPPPSFS